MTTQLQNEKQSIAVVLKFLETTTDKRFSSKVKRVFGSGALNKQLNTNADIELENGILISVKNKAGSFTVANLGTGKLAVKKWLNTIPISLDIALAESKNRKNEVSRLGVRWDTLVDSSKYKEYVIGPLLNFYYEMFMDKQTLVTFLQYLTAREAPYTFVVGSDGIDILSSKINISNNLSVKKINSKSIGIFDEDNKIFELRFKSAGGTVLSSIKINVQV